MSFETLIPAIAKIGYHGIELAVTPRFQTDLYSLDAPRRQQIRQMLGDHGLVLSAVAGQTPIADLDPDKSSLAMQRLRDSIDLAAELCQDGEPAVMISLLGGHEDDWGKLKEILVERVREIGAYAASRDVIFAVEPHSNQALDLPRKALWLLEQVDHPSVKLNFDQSHFDIRGLPMDEYIPQFAPHSVHTHVKDQRGIYPHYAFLTPGSGPFDFVHYLRALYDAGYDGWIGMEVSLQVQALTGYDALADANLGYWALVHAFNMSGVPLAPRQDLWAQV